MEKDTYTEISEKRTSKLGYLFLIALFVFLIIVGQTVFSDIRKIPERPLSPSNCAGRYLGTLKSIVQKPPCSFNSVDRKFGIPALVEALTPPLEEVIAANVEIQRLFKLIRNNENQLNVLRRKYDLSLQETMAAEEALMDKPGIKKQILALRASTSRSRERIAVLTPERDGVIAKMAAGQAELQKAWEKAKEYYKDKSAWYNFKILILKLLFILPLFLIFLRLYGKHKKKDSPYTIIITSVFFATTILLLEIVLIFLYDILPKAWLVRIFRALMNVPVLKYVVYYGTVALVILILGGVVYFIQKKIYNPKRAALRQLKAGKCPECSFTLGAAEHFCPVCGRQVRSACTHCQHARYVDLPSCPHCGKFDTDS